MGIFKAESHVSLRDFKPHINIILLRGNPDKTDIHTYIHTLYAVRPISTGIPLSPATLPIQL